MSLNLTQRRKGAKMGNFCSDASDGNRGGGAAAPFCVVDPSTTAAALIDAFASVVEKRAPAAPAHHSDHPALHAKLNCPPRIGRRSGFVASRARDLGGTTTFGCLWIDGLELHGRPAR